MLYGVATKNLNKAVKCNAGRFPPDFMFEIMWAFVRLRELIASHKELAKKIDHLERKVENHDLQLRDIFEAIRTLMALPPKRS
ncbi:MAG: hypothetical protein KCHDKBKB_02049 [Elusimicrobia bacterium]|nr:hypothetical protein [Elusimicrobiota bacterium]